MKNPFKAISDWRNKPLLSRSEQKKYELLGAFAGPFIGILLVVLGIAPIAVLLIRILD